MKILHCGLIDNFTLKVFQGPAFLMSNFLSLVLFLHYTLFQCVAFCVF